jgi:hypothetical protein
MLANGRFGVVPVVVALMFTFTMMDATEVAAAELLLYLLLVDRV